MLAEAVSALNSAMRLDAGGLTDTDPGLVADLDAALLTLVS